MEVKLSRQVEPYSLIHGHDRFIWNFEECSSVELLEFGSCEKLSDSQDKLVLFLALFQYKNGPSKYGDFHYGDKTVVMGLPILVRRHLFIEMVPWCWLRSLADC